MVVGIDIGSRTIKAAAVESGRLIDFQTAESGLDPHRQSLEMVKKYRPRRIVATGYGRHLARRHFAHDVITEIRAHALGARYFFPLCRTVIDIGGQDSKVISLDAEGRVLNFLMNDKCAAGTGRFLEIMATTLGYLLDEFGREALSSTGDLRIGSMCTVFAESEVISLKNQGNPPRDIARAVHLSVVDRLLPMVHRLGPEEDVVFSGGVARNPCIVQLLRELLGLPVSVSAAPDITGAVGAALHADRNSSPSAD